MQSKATRDAARQSAQAQLESARIAAEAAKFRPVGVTTRYGTSNFQFDPSGYLSGAGYTVSPELKAYQDRLQALTGGALTEAEMASNSMLHFNKVLKDLFGLGQHIYIKLQNKLHLRSTCNNNNLLAPSRERQYAQLQNQLFQSGRGGLSVGATGLRPSGAGGLGATTPEWKPTTTHWHNKICSWLLRHKKLVKECAFGAGLLGSGCRY
jgi:hypothetical protein